ncbi:MAG: DHH family phosphoesterase [Candidatus Micrarchaeaceae archaeon]
MKIAFEEVIKRIAALKGKKVMLTIHSLGDSDAIASAIALHELMPNSIISIPDTLTANATRILRKLGFDNAYIEKEFAYDAEAVIMLDVNNFGDCGRFREDLERYSKEIIAIDHHKLIYDSKAAIFSDESYNSTASIIFDIFKAINASIEKRLASLIAIGIISDSAEFKNATAKTFLQLGELFTIASTDYITLMEETEHFAPALDRSRTLQDLFSASMEIKYDLLFIYGLAHNYANLAADDAIKIGADIALFWTIGKNEIAFSARIRPNIDKRYDIHAGAIMGKLASIINGTGGGHPAAAGAYGNNIEKSEEFRDAFINEILEKISNRSL